MVKHVHIQVPPQGAHHGTMLPTYDMHRPGSTLQRRVEVVEKLGTLSQCSPTRGLIVLGPRVCGHGGPTFWRLAAWESSHEQCRLTAYISHRLYKPQCRLTARKSPAPCVRACGSRGRFCAVAPASGGDYPPLRALMFSCVVAVARALLCHRVVGHLCRHTDISRPSGFPPRFAAIGATGDPSIV